MASGDMMVMLKAVNEMNEKNLEMSHKAEALKEDKEWTNAQKMRLTKLASKFSEVMMKLSQQMQK